MAVAQDKPTAVHADPKGLIKVRPAYMPRNPYVHGVEGPCPKCEKGELKPTLMGKYVSTRHYRRVESINRYVYSCNNPACNYQNVALVIEM